MSRKNFYFNRKWFIILKNTKNRRYLYGKHCNSFKEIA
nr:MAG TPA: hypothetical protein [Caudoviricetes sp.]